MDQSRAIFEYLGRVKDPEIPVLSLHDMGILRGVQLAPENHPKREKALSDFHQLHPDAPANHGLHVYQITISPTYVGCPAMDRMAQDISESMYAKQLPFFIEEQIKPAWTTDWITEEGMKKMEEYGIAPPIKGSADKRTLFASTPMVKCPRCKSAKTVLVSAHGSTACKSLYKCESCLEPFEYFKCL